MPTDDGFYFRWGRPGPFFPVPFGSTRGRGGGGGLYAQPATRTTPPQPQPSTFPKTGNFPRVPGANDPVFKKSVFPKWLKLGGPWPNAIIIAVEILKEIGERQIEKEIEEARKADEVRERQRAADRQGPREVIVRNDPLSDPIPGRDLPNFPVFEPYPDHPRLPIPEPRPADAPDLPSDFPSQKPDIRLPAPIFFPSSPRRPAPASPPVRKPVTIPRTHPGNPVVPIQPSVYPYEILLPRSVPRSTPAFDPAPSFVGDPLGLTGPQPVGLSFPSNAPQNFALPQDQAQRCPQRKCKEDKRPRRKCYKKFVWESRYARNDIERQWDEIDCTTGRQI